MTVSAPVRFKPSPPTCVVSSSMSIEGSLLNLKQSTGYTTLTNSTAETDRETNRCTDIYWGFPTRMVYLYYMSCLRYTILVRNPRYRDIPFWSETLGIYIRINHILSLWHFSWYTSDNSLYTYNLFPHGTFWRDVPCSRSPLQTHHHTPIHLHKQAQTNVQTHIDMHRLTHTHTHTHTHASRYSHTEK